VAHILIVEDEGIVAMDLEGLVTELGHTVAGVASNADQALALAAETAPHLALMDIRLSGPRDGIEAATELRARFDIPVIYVTAYAGDQTVERARVTEPLGYIVKPFSLKVLRATLETALYRIAVEQRPEVRRARLTKALVGVDDAIFMVGADGVVNFVNPAAQELIGLERSAVGRSFDQVASALGPGERERSRDAVKPAAELEALSEREREIFDRLVAGQNIEEIAVELDVSVHTARNHRKAIFGKLQVHSQVKLMQRYLDLAPPRGA